MKDGPVWVRSFAASKPVLARLQSAGLVDKVAPPGGLGRNQVKLSDAGLHAVVRGTAVFGD